MSDAICYNLIMSWRVFKDFMLGFCVGVVLGPISLIVVPILPGKRPRSLPTQADDSKNIPLGKINNPVSNGERDVTHSATPLLNARRSAQIILE